MNNLTPEALLTIIGHLEVERRVMVAECQARDAAIGQLKAANEKLEAQLAAKARRTRKPKAPA